MDWLPLLQWPAMAVTITAGWLVGSSRSRRRLAGFCLFILGNALWIAWGVNEGGAWALVTLQLALFLTNVRGIRHNEPDAEQAEAG